MTNVLDHYDRFSSLIDLFRDWPYGKARAAAIEELHLQPGDCVVDLFCGTGVNFEPLLAGIGPAGRVVAVDGSEAMLERARRRIARRRVPAECIDLRRIDVAAKRDALREVFDRSPGPPKLLITLALGCFPNYDQVFGDIYELLPLGTRVALMEIYFNDGRQLNCTFVAIDGITVRHVVDGGVDAISVNDGVAKPCDMVSGPDEVEPDDGDDGTGAEDPDDGGSEDVDGPAP